MKSFLIRPRYSLALALVGAFVLSADLGCGRAVLGDSSASATTGNGGTGGDGGASNSSSGNNAGGNSSSSTMNSSSTGVMCSCELFCAALDPCGFGGPTCLPSCNNGEIPDQIVQCGCEAESCDELLACANSSTSVTSGTSGPTTTGQTSTSSGMNAQAVTSSSGTGGGGGGMSAACESCANNAVQSTCGNEAGLCLSSNACMTIVDCMGNCGWGNVCEAQCVNGPSAAVTAFYDLMACAVCTNCLPACQNDAIGEICF